jgi:hypothetical protein
MLLFQRPRESGLEFCPGRDAFTKFGFGDTWTKVEPIEGEIVRNMQAPLYPVFLLVMFNIKILRGIQLIAHFVVAIS